MLHFTSKPEAVSIVSFGFRELDRVKRRSLATLTDTGEIKAFNSTKA
jgi:hypothetical protein